MWSKWFPVNSGDSQGMDELCLLQTHPALHPGHSCPLCRLQGEGKPTPYDGLERRCLCEHEKETEETVKLHPYASSTGTEQTRPSATAKILAKDGSNTKPAHERVPRTSGSCRAHPVLQHPALLLLKRKKNPVLGRRCGASGQAHLLLPQMPPAAPLLALGPISSHRTCK